MNQTLSTETIGRIVLLRSIYILLAPVFMIFAALACAGTPLLSTPSYTCPTSMPGPTSTVLAGTPMPTPLPQPTPYIIVPPANFLVGDAVFIGTSTSENGVRLRLQNVAAQPASPGVDGEARNAYTWQLEVKNIGMADYEIFPSVQMVLSEITTTYGDQSGVWPATREAADEIGAPFGDKVYTLASGETRVFHFAAYGPAGQAKRFIFQLDPTVSEGSDVVTWINQTNPYCSGDVAG